MKTLKNNSGMTLVEIVLSILILGIGTMMLATCFSSAARITNRATMLKNASLAASSSIEVEDTVTSKDPNVDVAYSQSESPKVTISYTKNGSEGKFEQSGQYAEAKDSGTGLTYREFCPEGGTSYYVPTDNVSNDG